MNAYISTRCRLAVGHGECGDGACCCTCHDDDDTIGSGAGGILGYSCPDCASHGPHFPAGAWDEEGRVIYECGNCGTEFPPRADRA